MRKGVDREKTRWKPPILFHKMGIIKIHSSWKATHRADSWCCPQSLHQTDFCSTRSAPYSLSWPAWTSTPDITWTVIPILDFKLNVIVKDCKQTGLFDHTHTHTDTQTTNKPTSVCHFMIFWKCVVKVFSMRTNLTLVRSRPSSLVFVSIFPVSGSGFVRFRKARRPPPRTTCRWRT